VLSEKICVENCPFYDLPNTFTPNGDNQNDFFIPREFCFIERVDFQVYDRWGSLVFQTDNPELNWDGRNSRGDFLEAGTYYYRCQVFERRVDGVFANPELLRGYIELIR
jgi:gliding motility-associated-like protein